VSSEERRARRREQLLDAGLELFGTRGYAASSIREVCLAASLNRRYFYESFSTREDLLRAVYDQIVADLGQTLFAAVRDVEGIEAKIRAGMVAFWGSVTTDQRKARILTIEIIGVSEELERRRREARHGFAEFVAQQAADLAAADGRELRLDPTLTSRALVAATIDLVIDWMRDDVDLSVPELTEHCIALFMVTGAAAFYGPAT
jgi:AcrR family transcriptional regulator